MECRECMDLLADYVDGTLPKDQAELLDWHLEGCPNCVAFVNTYKGTVDAARRLRETKIPPSCSRSWSPSSSAPRAPDRPAPERSPQAESSFDVSR